MWHKSRGILRCFSRWVLLDCGREISGYYCSLYNREFFYRPKLQQPLWGGHISIVRGECELNQEIANEIRGMSIEFIYKSEMNTNGCHYYLPVICPLMDDIRILFGLGRSLVDYHLSIGNLRNAD